MARLPQKKKPSETEPILIEESLRLEYGTDSMETQHVEVDMSKFMEKFNKEAIEGELEVSPEHVTPEKEKEKKTEPAPWINHI